MSKDMNKNSSAFDTIIGYEEEKKEFERICDICRNPEKYRALGVNTPKGLLLIGEPGLGKTTMAKAVIKESGRYTVVCRKDKPDGDFVNSIRGAFEDAKKHAPSIVFLDDMDKFANEDRMHRNAEEFVTVQSCIDDCRDEEVFVLATANEDNCLPDSLLRAGRFDKILEICPPKFEDAVKIIRYYLSKKKFVSEIDAEQITRILDGRSCAELETVVNEAGIYAGFAGKTSIEMEDMVRACLRVIFNAPEGQEYDDEFLRTVAVHEAGHAVVNELLEPGSVNLVSVATYSGDVGGVTSYTQDKNYFHSKKYMENRVISVLGGKAATEITFGTTDVGANSDIHRAFSIVERFADNYCTYGFGEFERSSNMGTHAMDRKDTVISLEMQRYYSEARRLLCEHRDLLLRVADLLVEKKTLLRKDLDEIFAAA